VKDTSLPKHSPDTYSTRDLTQAAFLCSRGEALVRVQPGETTLLATFMFRDTPTLRTALLDYSSGTEVRVDLLRFMERRKELLRLAQAGVR
jgi:uncharacterized protein DUF5659